MNKQEFNRMSEYKGHRPLAPANQYCAYCGAALFIKEQSRKPCKNPRPEHFTEEDWEAEMQLAKELAEDCPSAGEIR